MDLKIAEFKMEKLNKAYFKIDKLCNKANKLRFHNFKKYGGIYEGLCITKLCIIELQDEVENELFKGD